MKLIAAADLHLTPNIFETDRWKRIHAFMQWILETQPNYLVLCGDTFDFWLEKEDFYPQEFAPFLELLKQIADRGTRVYLIYGNHDFLFGDVLTKQFGVFLAGDEVVLLHTHQGLHEQFYFAHGDRFTSYDWGYHLLRGFLHSQLVRRIVYALPEKWVFRMANTFSAKSRALTSSRRHPHQARGLRKKAKKLFAEGFQYVLMGHLHITDSYYENKKAFHILGEWFEDCSYFYYADGQGELRRWETP